MGTLLRDQEAAKEERAELEQELARWRAAAERSATILNEMLKEYADAGYRKPYFSRID